MTRKLGRYELLEQIGQGGFAVVYRARDTELDRLVALKELRILPLTDATWIERFRREARAIARLDHPRIVPIYDIGEADNRHFIVMRLVNGASLERLIALRAPLPWSYVVETLTAIGEGLDYAHTQGILHRDLKPGNILMDAERGALLSDFGFAKLLGENVHSVTASGDVLGTPHYIAPETWEGRPITAQADIYALGCILYEMLTGQKVFQGETPPAVMMAHFKPLELPGMWPEGVPPEIGQVFKIALAKNPVERYATAGELVTVLKELSGDRVSAHSFATAPMPVRPQPLPELPSAATQPLASELLETNAAELTGSTSYWRDKAERALAGGNLEGARSALYQWQELAPRAPEVTAFRERLEAAEQAEFSRLSKTATPPPVVVGHERKKWGCVWAVGLVIVGVIVAVMLGLGGLCASFERIVQTVLPTVEVGETTRTAVTVPRLNTAGPIDLDIEFGSGRLSLQPGAGTEVISGTAVYNVAQLVPKITVEGNNIRLEHETPVGWAGLTTANLQNEWDLKLGTAPLNLKIDTGAAKSDIELGGLSLLELEVSQGAASFELAFSEPNRVNMSLLRFKSNASTAELTGLANARAEAIIIESGLGDSTLDFSGNLQRDLEVTLEGGASSMTLIIPPGTPAQVTIESESTNITTQGDWQTAENGYTLPGEGPKIVVQASLEDGSLRLRTR